jgi:hypothetical protein
MVLICGIGDGTSIMETWKITSGGLIERGNTTERLAGNKKPL